MATRDELAQAYAQLQNEATALAGGLQDLAQRAAVYHHLYDHSHGNFIFPLIAAHGALWARGYFQFGMRLGDWLAVPLTAWPELRERRLAKLQAFADAFREINRRVCVDTYTLYYFTARYADHEEAARWVEPQLGAALRRIHAARERGKELPDAEKREIFHTFFLNEQQTVVGPRVSAAGDELDWPLMKWLALRPLVRFAYFPPGKRLFFWNFLNQRVRVKHGLAAFDLAAQAGWREVAARLEDYQILPRLFFDDAPANFRALRRQCAVSLAAEGC